MSDNKTIDNVHVHIYGHEMLGEVISRARKNNLPYDKEMKYDFHSHGHSYLVFKDGELTLLEDPSENHNAEVSLNDLFELYLSKEEVKKELEVGKWYKSWNDSYNGYDLSYYTGTGTDYGFHAENNNWFEEQYWIKNSMTSEWQEAPPQEVEQSLIEEAKRRGFVNGGVGNNSNIHDKKLKNCELFFNNQYEYDDKDNLLRVILDADTTWTVFKDGKWATIIEQDKFAELKEAHRNGAVIQLKMGNRWFDCDPVWTPIFTYRIKPEEGLKIGDKVIGIRTDCAIIGEVTSVSKKKVCVNNLAFLKYQVSLLTAVQYDDVRFLINGLKGHD